MFARECVSNTFHTSSTSQKTQLNKHTKHISRVTAPKRLPGLSLMDGLVVCCLRWDISPDGVAGRWSIVNVWWRLAEHEPEVAKGGKTKQQYKLWRVKKNTLKLSLVFFFFFDPPRSALYLFTKANELRKAETNWESRISCRSVKSQASPRTMKGVST